MALRTRPAAAFVFVLTMTACLAPIVAPAMAAQTPAGMILLARQPGADGTLYLWEVSSTQADSLAPWNPQTTAPPLPLEEATKAGEAWLKRRNPEIKTFEPSLVSLLRLRTPDRWYYRLGFDAIVDGKRVSAPGGLVVIVLFDGSVVEPRVEKNGALGGPGGPGGGTGGGPRTLAVPRPDAAGVYAEGSGVISPRVLRQTKVGYTPDAMRARIQGQVWLEAVVNTDGKVGDVKVVKSLDQVYGLDAEAAKTVKQWRFAPGTVQGVAVPVRIMVEMAFTLH